MQNKSFTASGTPGKIFQNLVFCQTFLHFLVLDQMLLLRKRLVFALSIFYIYDFVTSNEEIFLDLMSSKISFKL